MYLDKLPKPRKMLILAEGKFDHMTSKTANAVLRYQPESAVAVVDSTRAGRTAHDVLGYGGDIPILATLEEGLRKSPNILLIGIAPAGGRLPDTWIPLILKAIENKLSIISGLHTLLGEMQVFADAAKRHGITIVDLRKIPAEYEVVAKGIWKNRSTPTILTVGTDCNIGKKTALLEIREVMNRRRIRSVFVPTGQTGVLLTDSGIALDAIKSDFISGSIELAIERAIRPDTEYVLVEGQGALTHQGYSGVTLGLIHGTMPDAMILCHMESRKRDLHYNEPFPDIREVIRLHEEIVGFFKKSKVIGISLNTVGMTEEDARRAVMRYEDTLDLPATDPCRFGAEKLTDAIESYWRRKTVA